MWLCGLPQHVLLEKNRVQRVLPKQSYLQTAIETQCVVNVLTPVTASLLCGRGLETLAFLWSFQLNISHWWKTTCIYGITVVISHTVEVMTTVLSIRMTQHGLIELTLLENYLFKAIFTASGWLLVEGICLLNNNKKASSLVGQFGSLLKARSTHCKFTL